MDGDGAQPLISRHQIGRSQMEIVNSELLENVRAITVSGEKAVECFSDWRITECTYWRDPETNKVTTLTIMIEQNDAQLELD